VAWWWVICVHCSPLRFIRDNAVRAELEQFGPICDRDRTTVGPRPAQLPSPAVIATNAVLKQTKDLLALTARQHRKVYRSPPRHCIPTSFGSPSGGVAQPSGGVRSPSQLVVVEMEVEVRAVPEHSVEPTLALLPLPPGTQQPAAAATATKSTPNTNTNTNTNAATAGSSARPAVACTSITVCTAGRPGSGNSGLMLDDLLDDQLLKLMF
jgi:hypothetical protein